jgi:5'-3' exonuclease
MQDYYDQLTDDERARNKLGPDRLFIGKDHECAGFLKTIIEDTSGNGANAKSKCEMYELIHHRIYILHILAVCSSIWMRASAKA